MILLRFILIFALFYYLLKILFRWLAGSSSGRSKDRWMEEKGKKQEYGELTDQKIEDAEYEEFS